MRPTLPALLSVVTLAVAVHAQVAWVHRSSDRGELPIPGGSNNQSSCVVADFDGDGRQDFVVASRYAGGKVELWRFNGTSWRKDLIDPSDVTPEAGGATHDIDGDGDLDLVLGQDWGGTEIYWWENPRPNFGGTWTRRVIKSGGMTDHHDQAFGDFDGDGQAELVSWVNFTELAVFEIPSNPRNAGTWQSTVIYRARGQAEGAAAADIDGDGKVDIVAGGRWFKHQSGSTYAENVIDASLQLGRVAVAQIIPGGWPEVVLLPGHSSGEGFFYMWIGAAWTRNSLGFFSFGHTLAVADIDGDSKQDVLSGEMVLGGRGCRLRVHYGNGSGNFSEQLLSTGNDIHEGRLADVDGDGDFDIVHKPMDDRVPRIELWMNPRQGGGQTWQRHLVDGALPNTAVWIVAGDLNGDGLPDLAGGDAWYRNPGTLGETWTRAVVGSPLNNVSAIYDFDGDGDLDLFGTQGSGANTNPRMAWAENIGGGNFTVRANIAQGVGDFLQGVAVARFGGASAPLQIALSFHFGGNGVQMLTLPQDPRGQTWTWQAISPTDLKEDLDAGDIDGDGDLDLLLGTHWLENPAWQTHVLGSVADLTSVGTPEPDRNELADIDRDGDLDAIVGLENGREILWFENPRPAQSATTLWPRHIIAVVEGQGFSLDVADLDRDGDMDVVVGEHRGTTDNRVLILANNGTFTNWPQRVIDTMPASQGDHHDGTQVMDLDRDGDLDIFSTGWLVPKIWVYEGSGGGGGGGAVGPIDVEPAGGTFLIERRVSLSVPSHPTANIRYTLDGSEPNPNSPLYTTPLTVLNTSTLRAKAFAAALQPSVTATAEFARLGPHVGHWRFDDGRGGVAHNGAGGRDGQLVGARWAIGVVGTALQFNGQSDRVEIGNLDVSGNAVTIAAWIYADRFDHLPLQDSRFVSKTRSTYDQDHFWMLSSFADTQPRLRFRLRTNGYTTTLIASSATLPTQAWVHVAATYDGSMMRVWQNGQEVGAVAKSGPLDTDPNVTAWIGDNPTQAGSRPFAGRIDDVRLLTRALTANELRALASDRALPGVITYGIAQRACAGDIRIEPVGGTATAAARRSFGIGCVGAPSQTAGVLVIGATPLATPWPLVGALLWIGVDGRTLVIPVSSDANGQTRLAFSIAGLGALGPLATQFLWLNTPSCGINGQLSSSDAVYLFAP